MQEHQLAKALLCIFENADPLLEFTFQGELICMDQWRIYLPDLLAFFIPAQRF